MNSKPDTFDRLRKLTETLPQIATLGDFKIQSEDDPKSVAYEIEGGNAISYALLSLPKVSVARTLVTSGAKFPEHQHDEKEIIVIFSGSAMMTIKGEKTILHEGDCMMFESNVPHSGRALEDVWFIAITVPYSKDYPNDRQK